MKENEGKASHYHKNSKGMKKLEQTAVRKKNIIDRIKIVGHMFCSAQKRSATEQEKKKALEKRKEGSKHAFASQGAKEKS